MSALPESTRPRQLPRWLIVVVLVWCAALAVAPWAAITLLSDVLPDQLAAHWGADGQPDRFEPTDGAWIFQSVFCLIMPALLLGLGAALRQLRTMAPIAVGLSTFLSVLFVGTTYGQTEGAASGHVVELSIVVAIVGGLLTGVLLALAERRFAPAPVATRVPGSLPASAPRLRLRSGERVAWIGRPRAGVGTRSFGLLALLPMTVMAVVSAANHQWFMAAILFVLGAVLTLLVDATMRAVVIVDQVGVRVRAFSRFTMATIPLAEIESAEVTTVHWGDFGGLGLRTRISSDGGAGLISSSGEAVQVNRAGQGPFFMTVSPASDVAATINALVARS
ncbi:MAG: DUF1648 domain-containing protein [Arachnia sp.]